MQRLLTILLAAGFLAGTVVPVLGAEKAAPDVKTLFESKCSVCHGTDRPKSKTKDLKEWETTVFRMKGKKNAAISDDEAKIIVAYLAKNYGK
jgi:mono/diheme cytochrome c family protein